MKNREKWIFNGLIALYPCFATYAVPGITSLGLNELLAILFSIVFVVKKRGKVKITTKSNWYLIFTAYSIFVSLFMAMFIEQATVLDSINRIGRNVVQFILIALIGGALFDVEIFAKIYTIAGLITSIFLIVQKIAYLGMGIVIPWLIPGLKLHYTIEDQSEYYMHYISKYYHYGLSLRPTGGFSEPTTFACYVLPILALILVLRGKRHYVWNQNKALMSVAIISITAAVFSSTSATGIVGIGIIYAIYFIKQNKKNKWIIAFFPMCIGLIVATGAYLISTNEQVQTLMLRLSEISSTAGASSGNQRILRGYAVWMKLPLFMQLFGTGFGNISSTLLSYKITTPFDPYYGSAYMNAVAELLVSCGVVGLSLFALYFLKIMRRELCDFAELIGVFLVLMFSLNMLASADFVTIMIVIAETSLSKKERGIKE